jgi:integrase
MNSALTVNSIAESFLLNKKPRVKMSTYAAYVLALKKHVLPAFGSMNYDEVFNRNTIESYCLGRLSGGASVRVVKSEHRMLVALMNYASENYGLPIHNIRVDWPTRCTIRLRIETYSPQELATIIDYAVQHPSPASLGVLLTATSGMRIGEVCALQYNDINIDNQSITISKTVNRVYDYSGHTSVNMTTPKTASGARIIPLVPELVQLVKANKEVYPGDYFVCSGEAEPCEPRKMRSRYYRMVRDAGIDRCIKFHGLRHSFATCLIGEGEDVKTVSSILGHSKVATTLDLYCHPTLETKRKAIQRTFSEIFKRRR